MPDASVGEALHQLVQRTDEHCPGVLLPFNRVEYQYDSANMRTFGLRAYVDLALSSLSAAIEEEVLRRKEGLLAELEDIIRNMPPRETIRQHTGENLAWFGRASAAIEAWNPQKSEVWRRYLDQSRDMRATEGRLGISSLITLLHQARHDLQMDTLGPTDIVVGHKMVFDYFDEVRRIIEPARKDLLFVDPYLDAEFVSRYLPHVSPGVIVRLLAREKLAKLLPAVDAFIQQWGIRVEVRSISGFHDRYVFVDGASCYQSGASFKDGAKTSPTTLTQIVDAFVAMLKTYEDLWSRAKVER